MKNFTEEEKYEWSLLFSKIESEGFGYCFVDYSNWEDIKNKKFQKLKDDYLKAHTALESFIGEIQDQIQLQEEEEEE